jgi:sec-independent protein translocase protein TatA
MGIPGWVEILIVLVIVLLLFGPGRIGKVASELGKGIRNFKNGLSGADENKESADEEAKEKK